MPTRVRFCPDGTYPFRQSELRQGGGESLALLFAFAFDPCSLSFGTHHFRKLGGQNVFGGYQSSAQAF